MLAFDTSAWLARYLDSDARPVTVEAMKRHPKWCASSLVLAESLVAMDRLGLARAEAETLEDQMRSDWDRVHQIPVDHRCLTAATLIDTDPGGVSPGLQGDQHKRPTHAFG